MCDAQHNILFPITSEAVRFKSQDSIIKMISPHMSIHQQKNSQSHLSLIVMKWLCTIIYSLNGPVVIYVVEINQKLISFLTSASIKYKIFAIKEVF